MPFKQLSVIFLVALLGAGLGCFFGMRSTATNSCPNCCATSGTNWLRSQLATNQAQNEKLDRIEADFQTRKTQLQSALDEANRKLGRAIVAERAFNPEVEKSVEEIHHAMANLQKASIEHLFEMEKVLEPEQFEKLLKITAETLDQ